MVCHLSSVLIMPQTQADVGMKWIKVIISLLLSSAPGVCLFFTLTTENSDIRYVLSCMLLPVLLITILTNIVWFASEREVLPIPEEYLENLLVKKPDWQHDHDANAWVSMGKFISAGSVPDEHETKPAVSPLERLVAIKKQGYWLVSSK